MGSTLRETMSGVAHAARTALRPVSYEARAPTLRGIRYRDRHRRGVPPRVDVYLPDTPPPAAGHPSVILVHGGAFLMGSRSMRAVRFLAARLCAEGLAVACPDYRLLFRGGPLTAQLDDVAAVRDFWLGEASALHLDPARVCIGGLSAGGALALREAASAAVYDRVVGIYGLYDFGGITGPGADFVRRRLLGSADPEVWHRASPVAHAAHIDAPLLLVHGTGDRLVPFGQAEAVRDARPARTELLRFEGLPHGWLQDPSLPESSALASAVARFLRGSETSPP